MGELRAIVLTEEDVVEAQLRVVLPDPPIEHESAAAALLTQGALRSLHIGQQPPVGGHHVHVAHHHLGLVLGPVHTHADGASLGPIEQDAFHGISELETHAQVHGEQMERTRDAVHASHGIESALSVLQARDHAHEAGSAVGIAAVVRGEAIEELHGLRMIAERGPVHLIKAAEQFAGTHRGQGLQETTAQQLGRPVKGMFQKGAARGGKQVPGTRQMLAGGRPGYAQHPLQLAGEPFRITPAGDLHPILPEIAVRLIQPQVTEAAGHVHVRLAEQLLHQVGPCEERRAHIEPVPPFGELGKLAARRGRCLEDLHRVAFDGQPYGGCQASYPGPDDNGIGHGPENTWAW